MVGPPVTMVAESAADSTGRRGDSQPEVSRVLENGWPGKPFACRTAPRHCYTRSGGARSRGVPPAGFRARRPHTPVNRSAWSALIALALLAPLPWARSGERARPLVIRGCSVLDVTAGIMLA